MPRRVYLRLVQLLVVACVFLVPAAAAQAAPPATICRPRPCRSSHVAVAPARRTSSSRPATGATRRRGPRTPIPCRRVPARRVSQQWYASRARSSRPARERRLDDPVRYQPVVTILDPLHERGRLRARQRRQDGQQGERDRLRHARRRWHCCDATRARAPRWRTTRRRSACRSSPWASRADVTPPHIKRGLPVQQGAAGRRRRPTTRTVPSMRPRTSIRYRALGVP